ncbi:MAG: hypothetical protein HZA89_07910 [Verrucomicrobia bacterium]|nr:hypothetical protein [Verrucomicrobiota bacterium]
MEADFVKGDQSNPRSGVEVKSFGDPNSAALAKANLEARGIECWLTADDCGGMLAAMDAVQGVKLFVRSSDKSAATALLDSVVVSQPTLDEPAPVSKVTTETPPLLKWSLPQLAIGIIIGVLLCLLYQWVARRGAKSFLADTNSDGKVDEISLYQNGNLTAWSKDRNFDGVFDEWHHYDEYGRHTGSEFDNNFDRKADELWTYWNGVAIRMQLDTDFNGKPDATYTFKDGVLQQADWQPNGINIVTLREFFHHGILVEEWRDTNSDGKFDVTNRFDAFGNPAATNSFNLLSSPSK